LSNIDVHREERKKNYFFFDPQNYKQLAKLLTQNTKISKSIQNYEINNSYLEKKYIDKYQNFILKNIN